MALDISIKNTITHIFGTKSKPLGEKTQIKKANEFVSHNMLIQEKIDGTKLTVIRTDKNSENYAENYIVSYKDTVIFSDEFAHLTDLDLKNIKSKSIGISQYALVFDHLKKLDASKIPQNMEYSIEFAQNKDTLTRTYKNLGGMFLRTYAPVKYYIHDGVLISIPQKDEETDLKKIKEMASNLEIMNFPVIFDGKISSKSEIEKGIQSPQLREQFVKSNIDFKDPLSIVKEFGNMLLGVESILGGISEGVVLKLDNGEYFKYVQADQYDVEQRNDKKSKFQMSADETTEYFIKMRKLVSVVLSRIDLNQPRQQLLKHFQKIAAKLPIEKFPKNDKRNEIQIRDDAHETARVMISKSKTLGVSPKTIGVIPIAGKPLHIGHWKLIELASKENDRVVVYTSLADRNRKNELHVSGQTFAYFWNEFFIPQLPKNVKVKFTDSPVRHSIFELKWFEQLLTQDNIDVPMVKLYSDDHDVEGNFDGEQLEKYAPTMVKTNRIEKRGISRESTVKISGTQMREFLQSGDKTNFFKYLPPLQINQKQEIWDKMNKDIQNKMTAKEQIREILRDVVSQKISQNKNLNESGQSIAAVDPKTPKLLNGAPIRITKKISIEGGQASKVSSDIRKLTYALNDVLKFWKPNNPFIANGYMYNGSSQHLMHPERVKTIEKVKPTFGDIDIIIPIEKGKDLEEYLDKIDDNQVKWKPTAQNRITPEFYYVGRTRSYASIPDQTVTLWYYAPKKQIVQIDFEHDHMQIVDIDGEKFKKPSDWNKFSKDSPWDDILSGVKGLAGALMLRSVTRAATRIENGVVLTPGGSKKFQVGKELTDRDISNSAKHSMPSNYTLNTGGGGAGIRRAYRLLGKLPDGTPAYEFVEAKRKGELGAEFALIIDISKIFKVIFGNSPTNKELEVFRSFGGLTALMKKHLDKETFALALSRFYELLKNEHLSDKERTAIDSVVRKTLAT